MFGITSSQGPLSKKIIELIVEGDTSFCFCLIPETYSLSSDGILWWSNFVLSDRKYDNGGG